MIERNAALNSRPRLTFIELARFYGPLAASDISVSAVHPIVMASLARNAEATFDLAVYGSMFAILILLESPIVNVMHLANALVVNTARYRTVRHYALLIVACSSAVLIILAFTPMGALTLQRWMGLAPDLAHQAASVLRLFLIWPLMLGWRRLCQGVIIRQGRPAVVGWGTFSRAAVVAGAVSLMTTLRGGNTVHTASLILIMAMAIETLVVSLSALRMLRAGVLSRAEAEEVPLTLGEVNRFYMPLMLMTVLLVTTRPVLIAGLARLPQPETAIAAWSVVLSVTLLFSNHARGFQHMAIALADDRARYERIARFARLVGVVSTGALALIAITPPGTWFLGRVMGIEGSLQGIVRVGIFFTCLVPILRAIQNSIRGVLVRVGATKTINLIALSNVSILVVGAVLVAWLQLPGVLTTAALFGAAYLVEALVLRRTLQPKPLPVLSAYAP